MGTRAPNNRSEVRRRRARLQLWASGIVAVVIMSFGAAALLISEPDEYGSFALAAGAIMSGSVLGHHDPRTTSIYTAAHAEDLSAALADAGLG